jgi:hypothetical protein
VKKFTSKDINNEILINPLLISSNKWWFTMLIDNVIVDVTCTTKQYYKIYTHKNKQTSVDFLTFYDMAKARKINLQTKI